MNSMTIQIEEFTKKSLKNDKSGHDFTHSKRVLKNALIIAKNYPQVDIEVLILSCLLHDISFKDGFVKNHHLVSANQAEEILRKLKYPENLIQKVKIAIQDHVRKISLPLRSDSNLTIESKILVDADNLDALGQIGIKRAVQYNKNINRPIIISLEDKFNDSLYGSLKNIITWAEGMLTPEAEKMGRVRVKVMEEFIQKLEKNYKNINAKTFNQKQEVSAKEGNT